MKKNKILKTQKRTRKNRPFFPGIGTATIKQAKLKLGLNKSLTPVKIQKGKINTFVLSFLREEKKRGFLIIKGKKLFLKGTRLNFSNTGLERRKKKINFLKKINNFRGYRHKVFLPTRGQNTKTNAKTQKKKRTRNNFNLIKTKKKNANKSKKKK